jgi:hypothetical protein
MNPTINDTLEEQLREMLCEQQKEIKQLKAEVSCLKRSVAEEQDAKYRAYVKYADLQQEKNGRQNTRL